MIITLQDYRQKATNNLYRGCGKDKQYTDPTDYRNYLVMNKEVIRVEESYHIFIE